MTEEINYNEISREGLVDMLEEATDRIRELETALAGKHEMVCAYCKKKLPREDPLAILEHVKTCDLRPERKIFETWERVEKMYQHRIALLFAAGIKVVEAPAEQRDGSIKELAELLVKGPDNNGALPDPKA